MRKLRHALFLSAVAAAPLAAQGRVWTATDAASDKYSQYDAGPSAIFMGGERFYFVAGGQFIENRNGTASLHGVVASHTDAARRFVVKALFENHVSSSANAPAGSPKLELKAEAYAPTGPANASRWRYYTGWNIDLIGLGAYAGARVKGDRVGPAFQIGVGANGKNVKYGASGWFKMNIISQASNGPTMYVGGADININLSCAAKQCASAYKGAGNTHALFLDGDQFKFEGMPGSWVEASPGFARLSGNVVSIHDPNKRFYMVVFFGGLVAPGASGHAPSGSPKLELPANRYLPGGGNIDFSAWHYYTRLNGILFGKGDYRGAIVRLTRKGAAFQVGFGANGKTATYGASGWQHVKVLRNPCRGPKLNWASGDLNLDLGRDCPKPKFTLRTPPTFMAGSRSPQHVVVCGPKGITYRPIIYYSRSDDPSPISRWLKLDIGGRRDLHRIRCMHFNRSTNCWTGSLRIPSSMKGKKLFFQAAIISRPLISRPLPTTNVGHTTYN